MNDAFLMGMMNCFTDADEQLEACANVYRFILDVSRQRWTFDIFHGEERPAVRVVHVHPRLEDLSDARMTQLAKDLDLVLKPPKRAGRHHAGFHKLQRHFAPGMILLSQPDDSHAAFANLALQRVLPDVFWKRLFNLNRVLELEHGSQVITREQASPITILAQQASHPGA